MRAAVAVALLAALSLAASPALREDPVGPLTRETLFEKFPEWRAVVAAYEPDPEAVAKLRACGRDVRVEIYLGTWCPDSRSHVSEYFKVLDAAQAPSIRTVLVGIPRERDKRAPYYAGKDIVRIPTFFVYVDGREAGRIVETPETSVEADLVRILGL